MLSCAPIADGQAEHVEMIAYKERTQDFVIRRGRPYPAPYLLLLLEIRHAPWGPNSKLQIHEPAGTRRQ